MAGFSFGQCIISAREIRQSGKCCRVPQTVLGDGHFGFDREQSTGESIGDVGHTLERRVSLLLGPHPVRDRELLCLKNNAASESEH